MVKFTKQFEGQLVPEWKEAFVDYWKLKKDLKKIHLLNNNNQDTSSNKQSLVSSLRKYAFLQHKRRENGVIQVNFPPHTFVQFFHVNFGCMDL